MTVSFAEKRLIDLFRRCSDEGKDGLLVAAESLASSNQKKEVASMPKWTIQYIDGHDLKYKTFVTEAASPDDAISKLWEQYTSDFDHRIIDVYPVEDEKSSSL